MAAYLPALHAPRLGDEGDGATGFHRWHTLLELLRADGVETVSSAGLLAGHVASAAASPLLLSTSETRVRELASWSNLMAHTGFHSLVVLQSGELGEAGRLAPEELRALLGLGLIVGSAGVEGRPLVGLSVGELRRELTRSREVLSEGCGYPISTLAPIPDLHGRAFDGLVLREARRAGYTLLLAPGHGLNPLPVDDPLVYRALSVDDRPYGIRNWVLGTRQARAADRARSALSRVDALGRRLRGFMRPG